MQNGFEEIDLPRSQRQRLRHKAKTKSRLQKPHGCAKDQDLLLQKQNLCAEPKVQICAKYGELLKRSKRLPC